MVDNRLIADPDARELQGLPMLDQIIRKGKLARDAAQKERARDLVGEFVHQILDEGMTVSSDTVAMIEAQVAKIDELLSVQLEEINRHPSFVTLRRFWQGLYDYIGESGVLVKLEIRQVDSGRPSGPRSEHPPEAEEPTTRQELTDAVHREATQMQISQVARYLQNHLGQQLTAYLSGLKDAKVVGRWIRAKSFPRASTVLRLREAYQAARILTLAYGDDTTKSWFFGTNSALGTSPASALRSATTPDDTREVLEAAHRFVADELAWRHEEASG